MKYSVLVSDPAWSFNDKLVMSDVKRGAESNYKVMNNQDIIGLDVKSIVADDALLALWVPSSLLQEGLDAMKNYGFRQTQSLVWVKVKKNALNEPVMIKDSLNFGMGHLWRQTHEICLIGVRGKIYNHLKNKSQRSVHFDQNIKHSAKPEALQDSLDLMFPNLPRIEFFARRERTGWECVGNQLEKLNGEDIRDSIKRLSKKVEEPTSETDQKITAPLLTAI